MNYYELLQVTPSASAEVIKNAYKAMAKKYHPDLYQGNRTFAEEKMKLLNEAISILENDEKRREYNEENNFNVTFDRPLKNEGFMKDIDDFLNHSDSSGESPVADIKDITSFGGYSEEISDDPKPLFDYEEELIKAKASGRKGKTTIGKWYYIVIACLVAANIIIIALIIANFPTELLDSFSKDNASETGGTVDDHDEGMDVIIEDYIEPEDWSDNWNDGMAGESDVIEPVQDFMEADTSEEADSALLETTVDQAALVLPPTEPTTGKTLPAVTPKQSVIQKPVQPATAAPITEPETIPEDADIEMQEPTAEILEVIDEFTPKGEEPEEIYEPEEYGVPEPDEFTEAVTEAETEYYPENEDVYEEESPVDES